MNLPLRLAAAVVWCGVATSVAWGQLGPPAVVVTPVIEAEVAPRRNFVGTIMPLRRSVVGSAVDGRVVTLHADQGDFVPAGEPLVQLRTGTVELELAEARAALQLRASELEELRNGTRPEEIAQAKANLLSAESLQAFTQSRLKRTEQLYRQGSATEDEYDEVLSAYRRAEQDYLAAKAAYELAVAGPRQEVIAQAEARLQVQQEAVARIEDRMLKYTIKAPFDCFVTEEHIEVGHWVTTAEPAMTVIQLDRVEITVYVPEAYIQFVRRGMQAPFTAPALVDESGEPLRMQGEVARISPQADLNSRAFPVILTLENPKNSDGGYLLKAGMLCEVDLQTGQRRNELLVPKDALVLQSSRSWVYVVTPQSEGKGVVRRVDVGKGPAEETTIAVRAEQGLAVGDLVVVEGNERLRPGQEVVIAGRKENPAAQRSATGAE